MTDADFPSAAQVDIAVLGRRMPEGFDDYMTGRPKRRRHTVAVLEQAFREIAAGCDHIFEIGANDGRHTRGFLSGCGATVHAFEPNPYLFEFLKDINDPKLKLNTFALSDSSSVVERFYIPTDKVTGISSLNVHREYGFERVVGVSVQTADAYMKKELVSGSVAAWIDVEGHADLVMSGFKQSISNIKVALVEVETHDYYNRNPSLESVLNISKQAGLRIISRDWMNRGQFNILLARDDVSVTADLKNYSIFLNDCTNGFLSSRDSALVR